MDTETLIRTFPSVYHMAHEDAWLGIQRHGLLSVCALLDLFAIRGDQRQLIEARRRPECVAIEHPIHGRAIIRDNKPMDDIGLQRALNGITPQEWYQLLNGKVFFWLTEERLITLLSARAYRGGNHCVLTVDTRGLVERYNDRITLCPMNAGCTKPFPHPRGRDVFSSIADYPFEYWRRKKGGPRKAIVEFGIERGVLDIDELVTQVTIRNQNGIVRTVLNR
ncbi:MAG: hypothetical protein HZA88_04770 [Verrucomicrobia bacterium]|nr:hypothetical protein [Verrucomicrobiota bacterium]